MALAAIAVVPVPVVNVPKDDDALLMVKSPEPALVTPAPVNAPERSKLPPASTPIVAPPLDEIAPAKMLVPLARNAPAAPLPVPDMVKPSAVA